MANSDAPEAKKKSPWLIVVVTLIAGLGVGAGAMNFISRRSETHAQQEPQKSQVKAVLHLETFTLNMSDPDEKTYLRLGVDLGMERDPKGEGENGAPPTALVRDTILTVLMNTKAADLVPVDGKQKLKERIVQALQERAPQLGVREVYFTEFLMQR
jgi:flagellar FliL protein